LRYIPGLRIPAPGLSFVWYASAALYWIVGLVGWILNYMTWRTMAAAAAWLKEVARPPMAAITPLVACALVALPLFQIASLYAGFPAAGRFSLYSSPGVGVLLTISI